MGDAENVQPPSKKRVANKQLSRDDNFDAEEDAPEDEHGTFQRASEEVIARRRIVKVRRNTPAAESNAVGGSNPFAAIRLVPAAASSVKPKEDTEAEKNASATEENVSKEPAVNNVETLDEAKEENEPEEKQAVQESAVAEGNGKESKDTENEEKADAVKESPDNKEKEADENSPKEKSSAGSFSSFQQLSSTTNAFAGISGTGFASSSQFSFGLLPKSGDAGSAPFSSASFGNSKPLFETKLSVTDGLFGSTNSNGESSSFPLFGSLKTESATNQESGITSLKEVAVETGEEKEETIFTSLDATMFEFIGGGWKERGKGEIKVNVLKELGKSRLVMRAKGNYRLILNASLFPDMKLAPMDKRGVSFACMNSAGDSTKELSTFALRFKDATMVEEFRRIVDEHKGKASAVLKTPENSPKASED